MRKIVSIHQPTYFPWWGLIDKIAKSDVFIILDNVQFNNEAFQHRTLYSNPSGKPSYLTLSVESKNRLKNNLLIKDLRLKNQEAILAKHLHILKDRYRKTEQKTLLMEVLPKLLQKNKYTFLLDLTLKTIQLTLKTLGVRPQVMLASDLNCKGKKTELVLNLTKAVGGSTYLSGRGAEAYMDDILFNENGIALLYQDFVHPVYNQKLRSSPFQEGCLALEIALLESDPKNILKNHYNALGQTGALCSLHLE